MDKSTVSFGIGKRLRELRNAQGVSCQKLADILSERYNLKISEDSLRDYEIDNPNMSKALKLPNLGMRVEYLYCLADYYGVSMDYITGRSSIKATDVAVNALITQTGLSEKCIENLKIIHDVDTAANPAGKVKYETVETINCLVENLSERSEVLAWIGRYLSVPQISNKSYYVSPSGEIKQRSIGVSHEDDEFLQLDRYVVEGALLQQVMGELTLLKLKLNSDEYLDDLEKWKE